MAALDELAAPFLTNTLTSGSREVPHSLVCAVAGWAAKVAALHELSAGLPGVVIPADDRRHIKRHLRPPRGTSVWLAAMEWRPNILPGIDQTAFALSARGQIGGEPPDRHNSHATTIFFGHAVVQMWGTNTGRTLRPGGPYEDRLIPIWPFPERRGITWPRGKLLTVDEAVLLGRSVEHHFTGSIAPFGPDPLARHDDAP
jgi:hypothetical protein